METDYINRREVIETLQEGREMIRAAMDSLEFSGKDLDRLEGISEGITDCIDTVESIESADVRPVIPAQWIALDIYRSEGNYKCSNCGQPCYVPECMGEPMYSVCPNCGAKMGGQPC